MENILSQAKKLYPRNTLFFSATGALKSPMKVHTLRMSEITKGAIYDSEGCCIFIEGKWAEKV